MRTDAGRTRRLRRPILPRQVYLLATVNMAALGSLTAPAVVGIPARLAQLTPAGDRAAMLAVVLTLGSVGALAANPIFGILSDHTRSRLGRRRPWMLVGSVGTLAAAVFLALADTVPTIAIAWVTMQILCNATMAASDALLADSVPEPRRARSAGVYGAAAFLGAVPPLAMAAVFPDGLAFVVVLVALLATASTVACVAALRDPPNPPAQPSSGEESGGWRPRPGPVRPSPAFAGVWLQRLLFQLASTLVLAFTLYFLIDRMDVTAAEAASVTSASTLVGGAALVLAALATGRAAGRTGDYRPYLWLSLTGLAAAATLRSVATEPVMFWTSALLGGAAMGTFTTVNLALALRTIPPSRPGTYLGLLNVAGTLPQTVGPPIAAALLAIGGPDPMSGSDDNYVSLYLGATVVALAGFALLPRLRRVMRRPAPIASRGDVARRE